MTERGNKVASFCMLVSHEDGHRARHVFLTHERSLVVCCLYAVSWTLNDFLTPLLNTRSLGPQLRSNIFTFVRVASAITDLQGTLEIMATDAIHIESKQHVTENVLSHFNPLKQTSCDRYVPLITYKA